MLRGCDFFVSCDSVVPLKRDSNHLSSLPGIPLPLHRRTTFMRACPFNTNLSGLNWTSHWKQKAYQLAVVSGENDLDSGLVNAVITTVMPLFVRFFLHLLTNFQ